MIHAYRRPRNFRLLKEEYKRLNALPSNILQINEAVTRREKIVFDTFRTDVRLKSYTTSGRTLQRTHTVSIIKQTV